MEEEGKIGEGREGREAGERRGGLKCRIQKETIYMTTALLLDIRV